MSRPFDKEKFWSKVDTSSPDACWEWSASTDRDGYGRYYDLKGRHRAHRVAHEIAQEGRPEVVMHLCDNPSCCNPAHLKGGTHRENMADKVRKGRQAKGSKNGRAKLNEREVRAIKHELKEEGVIQAKIARDYGVSRWAIRDIAHGKTWTHVSLG